MACLQIVQCHGRVDEAHRKVKEAWGTQNIEKAAAQFIVQYNSHCWPKPMFDYEQYKDSPDFNHLIDCISEFIKKGFNREEDKKNELWKVLPSTDVPWLFNAVGTWALADFPGIKLGDWNVYKSAVYHGKTYDIEDVMTSKRHDRVRRYLTSKKCGKLVHDKTLLKDADLWYKCRVNPGTIEAYLNEASWQSEADLERSNVEIAIAPYDEATDYPRKWRK